MYTFFRDRVKNIIALFCVIALLFCLTSQFVFAEPFGAEILITVNTRSISDDKDYTASNASQDYFIIYDISAFEFVSNSLTGFQGLLPSESNSYFIKDTTFVAGQNPTMDGKTGTRVVLDNSQNKTGDIFTLKLYVKENTEDAKYPIQAYTKAGRNNEGYIKVTPTEITVDSSGGGTSPLPAAGGSIPATGDVAYDVTWNYGGEVAAAGDDSYTIKPNDGYVVDEIYVDGVLNTSALESVETGIYTYNGGTPDRSLAIHFAYTVNFDSPANGTLSVSRGGETLTSGDIVRGGETLTITATPETAGYKLADNGVTVATFDGEPVDVTPGVEPNTYTFIVPGDPINVAAEFTEVESRSYQIAVTPPNIPEGGQIYAVLVNDLAMSGIATSAKAGDTVYVSINAGGTTGYQRKTPTYTAAGEEPVPLTTYTTPGNVLYWTFTMPAKDVTLSVEYDQIPYNLTVEPSEFGTIVLDRYTAYFGETVTGTVTPNSGWLVRSVMTSNATDGGTRGNSSNTALTPGPFDFAYTINSYNVYDLVVSARYYVPPDWQGSGTEDDPYLIEDEARLVEVRDRIKADNLTDMATAHFKLMADLDLTKVEENWDGAFGLYAFDGGGHTINYSSSNMEMTSQGTALFRGVGTLRNLTVTGKSES
jgi:hypothetical protein